MRRKREARKVGPAAGESDAGETVLALDTVEFLSMLGTSGPGSSNRGAPLPFSQRVCRMVS
ncbi:hypothetical protein GCM10009768_20300 [Leucobacter iarius]|uniref:Uncharacterized protein n=1 Tax=Leucobacter iarius TaxID=333963 RepID=A0ABP4XV12_9MICO